MTVEHELAGVVVDQRDEVARPEVLLTDQRSSGAVLHPVGQALQQTVPVCVELRDRLVELSLGDALLQLGQVVRVVQVAHGLLAQHGLAGVTEPVDPALHLLRLVDGVRRVEGGVDVDGQQVEDRLDRVEARAVRTDRHPHRVLFDLEVGDQHRQALTGDVHRRRVDQARPGGRHVLERGLVEDVRHEDVVVVHEPLVPVLTPGHRLQLGDQRVRPVRGSDHQGDALAHEVVDPLHGQLAGSRRVHVLVGRGVEEHHLAGNERQTAAQVTLGEAAVLSVGRALLLEDPVRRAGVTGATGLLGLVLLERHDGAHRQVRALHREELELVGQVDPHVHGRDPVRRKVLVLQPVGHRVERLALGGVTTVEQSPGHPVLHVLHATLETHLLLRSHVAGHAQV